MTPQELLFAVSKGPHAADELPKLLSALGVDPQKLSSADPALMRSLQRICITCGHKDQCQHNLAAGTAAGHYRYYCPNAVSLDALFQRNDSAVAPRKDETPAEEQIFRCMTAPRIVNF